LYFLSPRAFHLTSCIRALCLALGARTRRSSVVWHSSDGLWPDQHLRRLQEHVHFDELGKRQRALWGMLPRAMLFAVCYDNFRIHKLDWRASECWFHENFEAIFFFCIHCARFLHICWTFSLPPFSFHGNCIRVNVHKSGAIPLGSHEKWHRPCRDGLRQGARVFLVSLSQKDWNLSCSFSFI